MNYDNSQITNQKIIRIPNGVEKIEDNTGANNDTVEEVVFPGSIISIRNRVFSCCPNLNKVSFKRTNAKEEQWNGSGIFSECPNLKEVCFADFETFDTYTYDTFGPLQNGSRLKIGRRYIKDFIIPDNLGEGRHHCLRNLCGAEGIESIRFQDGTDPIGFSYEIDNEHMYGTRYGITKKEYVDKVLQMNLGINKNMKIHSFESVDEMINGFFPHVTTICFSFEEFEKAYFESMNSVKPRSRYRRW